MPGPHDLPVPVELARRRTILSTLTPALARALRAAVQPPARCSRCGLPMVTTPTGRRCPIGDRP
jgi:hypothetical protein